MVYRNKPQKGEGYSVELPDQLLFNVIVALVTEVTCISRGIALNLLQGGTSTFSCQRENACTIIQMYA